MKQKILIGSIVGLLSLSAIYFINQSEDKKQIRSVPDHELNALNDYGPQKGPLYAEMEPVKAKITVGKEIYHKPKKVEKKKDIVMIDGIPYERYKGYLMPPEPDEEENKKTLLGIDVNKNFVRDDLERRYVKNSKSKVRLGKIMQYARIYQMQLSNEKTLPMSDLLIKMRLSLGTLGDGIRKQVGNTPERERRVEGGVGAGVYAIPNTNDFTRYVFRDFTFPKDTKDNDFSGYEWSMDFYEDKPFPLYGPLGSISNFYYKGKSTKIIRGEKFCELNFGKKECEEEKKEHIRKFDGYNNFHKRLKSGEVDKFLEGQNKRLAERNWYE